MTRITQDIEELERMIIDNAEKDEIRSQLRFIMTQVETLQAEFARIEQEYAALQESHAQLEAARAQPQLEHLRGLYYASGDSVPFCPRCYEAAGPRIHLSGPIPMWASDVEHWECHTCHAAYSAKPNQTFLPVSRRRAQKA